MIHGHSVNVPDCGVRQESRGASEQREDTKIETAGRAKGRDDVAA
jgi:hypothetical protein